MADDRNDGRKLIGVRIDKEVLKELKLYTTINNITIQDYINDILARDLKKKGYERGQKYVPIG